MAGTCPEPAVQRALAEPFLERRLVEGEFWYTVVSEWLQQWKRHAGFLQPKKYYHTRASPGPVITQKEFGHNSELIHEDLWKLVVSWFGLADGHKANKHVVYDYANRLEVEHNFNTFRIAVADGQQHEEEPYCLRFSKIEKVGHVEMKAREVYQVDPDHMTRLWGKIIETDTKWKPLFRRDKAIGKLLELESDFLRCALVVEVCDPEGNWTYRQNNMNEEVEEGMSQLPVGKLQEKSIFEDLTSGWERDIHQHIDTVGRGFMRQLHASFSSFVTRAKDFVDDRENTLRETEQQISSREEAVREREAKLQIVEQELNLRVQQQEAAAKEFALKCKEHLAAMEEDRQKQTEELQQSRRTLEMQQEELKEAQDKFSLELQKMNQLHKIQESRIKLDIGGHMFTTSHLTLTSDPDSMLAAMFSGRHELHLEADGSYFIDRDGTHFRYILNFLRDGGIKDGTLPHNDNLWRELLTEAQYYQLAGLAEYLQGLLAGHAV